MTYQMVITKIGAFKLINFFQDETVFLTLSFF